MSRVNVFGLPRPTRPQSTKTYYRAGADEIALTLRWPNASDRSLASEDAAELVRNFITGDEALGREAATFPDPEVIPSSTLFQACALVARMQLGEEADRYDALTLAVLSARLPQVWIAIQQEVNRLLMEGDKRQGELPGTPSTGSSVETPSSSTTSTP